MYIFYLDDSGNTGTDLDNPEQPIHFLAGIGIHISCMQKVENSIESIYPLFAPYSQNFDFELHGVDLFQGKKYFKNFKLQERLRAIEKVIEIAESNKVRFFSQGIHKQKLKERYTTPYPPAKIAFQYLVEKIDIFLEEQNSLGMVVIDQDKGREQQVINDFWRFRRVGTPYGLGAREIKCIIDHPFYIHSYNSHLLQLADVLTYVYASNEVAACLCKPKKNLAQQIALWSERIKRIAYYHKIDPQ